MIRFLSIFSVLLFTGASCFASEVRVAVSKPATPRDQIVVSVPEQKLALIEDGQVIKTFPVSTSRYGVGDGFGSYRTPVGLLRICDKMGTGLPEGSVFKRQHFTGEILQPNAPGRDPIVTRIIRLEGMDASTSHALDRNIYIHGTPEERLIGRPASYGCIRMRSRDVVEVYDMVSVGTPVVITEDKLPHQHFSLTTFLAANFAVSGLGSFDPR